MFERCLYFNLNALVRKVDKIWEQAFSELGLSPAHAYLLRLVLSQPSITQKQIADELHLEKSTVTRFIDALEEKGYLRRTRSGREQTIVPSAAARRLEVQLSAQGDALYARMVNAIGRADMVELVRRLRETADKLQ
ncbi:MAG: MarR family transcriptional regulator [Gammaproteobacteria bacterium]|nr:MarR family transcriptional regulator [Gammaproteobacteria bacterium]